MKHSDKTLSAVIIEHLPKIRRFAFALTGSQSEADDLLQATVERLLSKGAPLGKNFSQWMYTVCKNLWIDEVRRNAKRITPGNDTVESKLEAIDGETLMISKLSLDEVSHSMNLLDDEQRTVLALVSLEGYSYKEVAEIMEIPIGTVMSRLARARQKLSQSLLLKSSP